MGIEIEIIAAVCFVSILVVVWYLWWSRRNSIVIDWPVLGMVPALLYNASRIHEFATDVLHQNNGTFFVKGPWFGSAMDFLLTSDPMNVHHTFSKNFSNYPKGPDFNHIFDYLGDGIFTVDSDSWRIQRNMIHSLFKDKRFELVVQTSMHKKISQGLFSVLDRACELGNYEVDLKDMFQCFTFDHICILIFGMDPNTLSSNMESPSAPAKDAFDDIAQVFFYRHIVPGVIWKLQRWLRIGQERKMIKACRTFDHFLDCCIKTKQDQLRDQNINEFEFDVLTYFLQNEKDELITNKFIRDMAVNLMFAGRDTTSSALSWTFWLIANNPSSQNKILEEMEQHFGTDHSDELRFFDFEKMTKLVYLHGVICEALRFYPSVPFERKVSTESNVLPSGHHISKNTRIVYSLYAMGRMKEIWGEDCLEFKPERWILESGSGIKHYPSYKFTAFNAGPRTCLGKNLAFSQMKAVVCAILWNYSLRFTEGQNVMPSSSILLHPKNGLKVRVIKRNEAC